MTNRKNLAALKKRPSLLQSALVRNSICIVMHYSQLSLIYTKRLLRFDIKYEISVWPAPDNFNEQQAPNKMLIQLQLKRLLHKCAMHFVLRMVIHIHTILLRSTSTEHRNRLKCEL